MALGKKRYVVPSAYKGMTAGALHVLLTCAAAEDLRQNADIPLALLAECAAAHSVQQDAAQYNAAALERIAQESDEAIYACALAAMRKLGIDFQQASKCAAAAMLEIASGPCPGMMQALCMLAAF